jgi:hypothetical protein
LRKFASLDKMLITFSTTAKDKLAPGYFGAQAMNWLV